MKSRGKKLERQYDQIFDYWTHIVPHRPPFVILCNFDEFWIYDFNQQLFDPVEKIALADLPIAPRPSPFLLPKPRKPLFNNNRVEVTREAAADLARSSAPSSRAARTGPAPSASSSSSSSPWFPRTWTCCRAKSSPASSPSAAKRAKTPTTSSADCSAR
jgi:hypothetical protein